MIDHAKLAAALADMRRAAGLRQRDIYPLPAYVCDLEKGRRNIGLTQLEWYAEALDCRMSFLLSFGEDDEDD